MLVSLYSVFMTWVLFEKCGEHGWKALIPFYNTFIHFKLAKAKVLGIVTALLMVGVIIASFGLVIAYQDQMTAILESGYAGTAIDSPEVALALSAPAGMTGLIIVSLAVSVLSMVGNYKFGKQFGQKGGFLVGLMFFPLIFRSILAFSSSYSYEGLEFDWSA